MRILVTGAAGFIGSVVTQRLVEEGHAVIAITQARRRGTVIEDVPQVRIGETRPHFNT